VRRFFVPAEILQGETVEFPQELLQHLHVLRLRGGAEIELLDGQGGINVVRIERLERREGSGQILARRQETDSAFPVQLLQSLPKGEKLELVLQKGVELGVSHFTPLLSGRSVSRGKASTSRHQRWQRVVQEAARQCRRPGIPRLDDVCSLEEGVRRCEAPLRLMLWEEGATPLSDVLPGTAPSSAAVLIGPEGGFAAEEVEVARAAGFVPVLLGPRILRTETAGLAAVTLLQYLYGDLNQA